MQQLPYDGANPDPCFIGWYTDWCIFEVYFHQNVYFQVSALGLNFGGKFKSRRDHRFPPIRCDEIQSQFQTSWLNIFWTTFQKGIWIEIPFPKASFSRIICTKSNYSQQSKLDWKLGHSAAFIECYIKMSSNIMNFVQHLNFQISALRQISTPLPLQMVCFTAHLRRLNYTFSKTWQWYLG